MQFPSGIQGRYKFEIQGDFSTTFVRSKEKVKIGTEIYREVV